MAVLLMRLAGPMQSWGTQSRFNVRDTNLDPSKSGVIGLVCAALGKPRVEVPGDGHPLLADLGALRMGVRVDREGVRKVDYQTAGGGSFNGVDYGVAKADGSSGDTVLSNRYYLCDAVFLVGLEGDSPLLRRIQDALRAPVWQLSLGRKSFVPDGPVYLPDKAPWKGGWGDGTLETHLAALPPVTDLLDPAEPEGEPGDGLRRIRMVIECLREDGAGVRMDQPLCFQPRRFGVRHVKTDWMPMPGRG